MDYRVEIVIDGTAFNEIGIITLENEGKWEELVTFSANHSGNDQKVEFLLYRDGQSEVYRSIHLWIDVR